MKKAIIISCLSLSVFGASILPNSVSAMELTSESTSTEIQPRVKWSGNAYITTTGYSNVTTSNNFFSDSPSVTNDSGNNGAILVKIVNSSGNQVGTTKEVGKGKTVKMDKIPWNSGSYTLKAKAVTKNGSYLITID
ncbi:hypothetical protein ABE021_14300 [Sporosarcina gallistercoris]|uniref:hypothetical protein n=1 Tax=Caryophanaceae TaxID=186818 RepID=UPI000D36A27B|nr:hypothetical protein [Metalysinibacillus jejuensis]